MEYNPDDALKLENQLCFPLYAAARKVTSAYAPLLKASGLTYTQYIVMLVLWERDGISVGELGSRLRLDCGTVTPLLKKLESGGYVKRTRSRRDERVVTVRLTDAGAALKEKVRDVPAGMGKCMKLSPEEAAELYRLLYRILEED